MPEDFGEAFQDLLSRVPEGVHEARGEQLRVTHEDQDPAPSAQEPGGDDKHGNTTPESAVEPPSVVLAAVRYFNQRLKRYPAKGKYWAGLSRDEDGTQRVTVSESEGQWRIEMLLRYDGDIRSHAALLRGLIQICEGEEEFASVDLKLFADPAKPELSPRVRRGLTIRTKNTYYDVRYRPPSVKMVVLWPKESDGKVSDSKEPEEQSAQVKQ
jgi:hypothetical protein